MVAKYKVVVQELEKEIMDGKYVYNAKLPTEDELMKKFEVSRNTIRKAIDILVEQGYLYQVQGSGIFLREFTKPGCISLKNMVGLTKEFEKEELKSKLLKLEIIDADEKLSKLLKCKSGTKIYYVNRVRELNGKPLVLEESYFIKDIIKYLNKEICESSIYSYIQDHLNVKIGFADKMISSEKLTEEDAAILALEENDPSLIVENTVFLNSGVIFSSSREKYNYTTTKLLALTSY